MVNSAAMMNEEEFAALGIGVPGYVPSCSSVSKTDNIADAVAFNPLSWEYYKTLVPTVLPGVVLGGLCAFGFLSFLLWCCCLGCRRCCARNKRKRRLKAEASQAQFLTEGYEPSSSGLASQPPGVRPHGGKASCLPWRAAAPAAAVLNCLLWLLALALVGISIWGLVLSIQTTNSTVGDFWGMVRSLETAIMAVLDQLRAVNGTVADAFTVAQQVLATFTAAQLQPLLSRVGLSAGTAKEALDTVGEFVSASGTVTQSIESADQYVNGTLLNAISSFRTNFEPPTLAIQDKWRFIPLAVVFGLAILAAALVALLVPRMRFRKSAALSVALLWLVVTLLMLLGVGLMSGVYTVTEDGCLAAETFAIRYALAEVTNPEDRRLVYEALAYVFSNRSEPGGQLVANITGADIDSVLQVIQDGSVQGLTTLLNSTNSAEQLRELGFSDQETQVLRNLGRVLGSLDASVTSLLKEFVLSNIRSIYKEAKEYLCCNLSDTFKNLFISWTCAGAIGFCLALLGSARVVHESLLRRKQQRLQAVQLVGNPAAEYPASRRAVWGDDGHTEAAGVTATWATRSHRHPVAEYPAVGQTDRGEDVGAGPGVTGSWATRSHRAQ